jgi:hypothetical protein
VKNANIFAPRRETQVDLDSQGSVLSIPEIHVAPPRCAERSDPLRPEENIQHRRRDISRDRKLTRDDQSLAPFVPGSRPKIDQGQGQRFFSAFRSPGWSTFCGHSYAHTYDLGHDTV